MDDAGPASNHLMFQDVLDTLARLKRAHDADARGLRLDQNLLRLVYQQGVIDYYDPHNATAFVNFHIKFEPEMAMLMMAEFLSTGEMLPDDARYCFKWIDEAQKEKKLVSSAIFRPTNTTGALGDYWIHRLQADVCGICRKGKVGHNRLTCPYKDGRPRVDTLYLGKNKEKKVF